MKDNLQRDLRKYKRAIRSLLIINTKVSKKFMEDLSVEMDNFIAVENVGDIQKVRDRFGAPEAIAKAFFETAELSYIRKRVRIKNIVMAVFLIALFFWGIGIGYALVDTYKTNRGYGIEEGPFSPENDPYGTEVIIE